MYSTVYYMYDTGPQVGMPVLVLYIHIHTYMHGIKSYMLLLPKDTTTDAL